MVKRGRAKRTPEPAAQKLNARHRELLAMGLELGRGDRMRGVILPKKGLQELRKLLAEAADLRTEISVLPWLMFLVR